MTFASNSLMLLKHLSRSITGISIILLSIAGCSTGNTPTSAQQNIGPIVVEIWASDGCASQGEQVTVRATVTNRGKDLFRVNLENQPVLDIHFGPANGGYRWSQGKQLTPDLTHLELSQGQAKSIETQILADLSEPANRLIRARFIYSDKFADTPVQPVISLRDSCPPHLAIQ